MCKQMARALVLFTLALLACAWLNPAAATDVQHRLSRRLRQTSTSSAAATTSDGDSFPFSLNFPPPLPFRPENGWLTGEVLGGIKVRAFNQPDAGPTLEDGVTKPYVGKWYYKNLQEPAADKAYEVCGRPSMLGTVRLHSPTRSVAGDRLSWLPLQRLWRKIERI